MQCAFRLPGVDTTCIAFLVYLFPLYCVSENSKKFQELLKTALEKYAVGKDGYCSLFNSLWGGGYNVAAIVRKCVCARACVRACVCACVHACVRAR